jgi:hypothetical protein
MPELVITDPTPIPDAAELATLKKINVELLQAKHTLKAKIEQLESNAATLESRAGKAESIMRAAVIDVPMRRLAEGIAHVPSLFIEQLRKDYRVDVDADSGELRLLTKEDGKVVTNSKGEPVAMAHNALYQLLAGSPHEQKDDARKKVYATLMKYSGASGGVGRKAASFPSVASGEDARQDVSPSFGLR